MNSSDYSDDEPRLTECTDGLVDPQQVLVKKVEIFHAEKCEQSANVEYTVQTGTSNITSTVNELEDTWASNSAEESEVMELTSMNSTQLEYEAESWSPPVISAQFDIEARNNRTSPVNTQFEAKDNGTPSNSSNNEARDTWTSPVNSAQFDNRESWTSPVSNQETDQWKDSQASLTGSEISVQREEKWSDTLTSPPGLADDTLTSDTAPPCEQTSEMYYTASSEVSLLSDTEIPDKAKEECLDKEGKECVIAGHVAAMRERFESMTRANTPCPADLLRSSSPSLDVFRNVTPSPDRLG